MRPFGVYVHFPWCAHHCPYCDFAVEVARAIPQERYAQAVLAELEARADDAAGLELVSVYLGGGTPSLQEPALTAALIAAVLRRFPRGGAGLEVTLEANPESCSPERLALWRQAGVTRVSVGVQSFDPAVLAKLGRRHGPELAERALRNAAEAVPAVAADLIYGARRSSVGTARADAARLASLPVSHVSAYALTVEGDALAEETPFARLRREGRLPLPPDDEVVAQGRALRAALRRGGLRRYEVSNFARPGFEAVHNSIYWESGWWLGLGAGATGSVELAPRVEAGAPGRPRAAGEPMDPESGKPPRSAGPGDGRASGALPSATALRRRWSNHRSAGAYLAAVEEGRLPTAEEELLGPRELAEERVMLALRTRRGLPLEELGASKAREVAELVRARLAVVREGRLVLTSRGLDLHSAVVGRLL